MKTLTCCTHRHHHHHHYPPPTSANNTNSMKKRPPTTTTTTTTTTMTTKMTTTVTGNGRSRNTEFGKIWQVPGLDKGHTRTSVCVCVCAPYQRMIRHALEGFPKQPGANTLPCSSMSSNVQFRGCKQNATTSSEHATVALSMGLYTIL